MMNQPHRYEPTNKMNTNPHTQYHTPTTQGQATPPSPTSSGAAASCAQVLPSLHHSRAGRLLQEAKSNEIESHGPDAGLWFYPFACDCGGTDQILWGQP
jgi:hypothetical protein